MSGATTAGAAAAAAAAMIQAVKAMGVIVHVEAGVFRSLAEKNANGLVIHSTGGFFTTTYRYLMSYKGLAFFTEASSPLPLPATMEVIRAKTLWVPS